MNDMIPFEIFKSLEICAYVHRFLFEIAKYIYRECASLYDVYVLSNDDNLLVPELDIVPAYRYTQRNATHVSNMGGVGLQFLSQSNGVEYFAIANQDIYKTARTNNGIFGTGKFTTKYCITKLPFQ